MIRRWMFLISSGALSLLSYLGLSTFQDWFFAFTYSELYAESLTAPLEKIKTKFFEPLKTLVSKDSHLARQNGLRVLEIGAGPGFNIKFFRKGTRWIVVDRNKFFAKYLLRNLKPYPGVTLERHLICPAENMSDIPDGSIDVVLSTYVFCSVSDPAKVLKEILRILAPGGHLIYFEHVGYNPGSWSRLFQHLVQPFWGVIANGCNLTRETSQRIRKAGFVSVTEDKTIIEKTFYAMKPTIYGIAQK